MPHNNMQGILKAKEINKDRFLQAMELSEKGHKIIGYLCSYVPLEIIEAFDFVPFRIYGDMEEPITDVEDMLPESFCPFVRSILDLVKKGRYNFLDGIVTVHSCDPQEKMAHIWKSLIPYNFFYYLDMPNTKHEWAMPFFRENIKNFIKALEKYTGKELDTVKLGETIQLYNLQRDMIKKLYEQNKNNPPVISCVEIIEIIKAIQSLPVKEGNQLLEQILEEISNIQENRLKSGPRILIISASIDDTSIVGLVENAGANIVIDDNCVGSRTYHYKVNISDDPSNELARRYLMLNCPKTFTEAEVEENKKDHVADLESRFSYLKTLIDGWSIDGVIISLVRFCDPFGYDLRDLRDYLDLIEMPNIYIEHNYTKGGLAPLTTRIEAFLEMLHI
jgi:benzoyl-CoA reductase/2-hydroxyglutaryl-CoA dehydratase subunit BcrC/BadD/HgdB